MTVEELDEIKLKGRWPIWFSDFYGHYLFVVFPLFFIVVGPAMLHSGIINGATDLKAIGLAFIAVGTILMIVIIKSLSKIKLLRITKFKVCRLIKFGPL